MANDSLQLAKPMFLENVSHPKIFQKLLIHFILLNTNLLSEKEANLGHD